MKKLGALILTAFILAFTLTGCGPSFLKTSQILNIENPTGKIYLDVYNELIDEVVVEQRVFEFVLYYGDAPNTVANFISLVESGYYTNKSFEKDSSNDPFVIFGVNEFIDGEENDDGELKYEKRAVKPKYYIIGEFEYNAYWDKNKEPRNPNKAGIGSMMMTREINPDNHKTKYNTAYAGFKIQTEVAAKKEYEKSFCVFGQITKLNDGTKFASEDFKGQLLSHFFESGFSTDYDGSGNPWKYRIVKVEINYPEGVTKNDFKPRTIKVKS